MSYPIRDLCSCFGIGHWLGSKLEDEVAWLSRSPFGVVQGRTYDGHILDMVEFGVSGFLGLDSFKGVDKKRLGTKPCMLFVGDTWEHDEKIQRVKNLLIGKLAAVASHPYSSSGLLSGSIGGTTLSSRRGTTWETHFDSQYCLEVLY